MLYLLRIGSKPDQLQNGRSLPVDVTCPALARLVYGSSQRLLAKNEKDTSAIAGLLDFELV